MSYYSLTMLYSGSIMCYVIKAYTPEEAFSKLQETTNISSSPRDWTIKELDKEVNCII